MNLFASFESLKNRLFRRLYAAEVISLLGDAITWVGIALLAFELAGDGAAVVLSIALTLRVAAFVVFSPYAGVLADRMDRKNILITTHLCRMACIALLPFVQSVFQIYVIILAVNIFRAFFVPSLKASIPQLVPESDRYKKAIALYSGTYQILGVLGPAVAGVLAGWLGARSVFFVDAGTFIIAAIVIFTLPTTLKVATEKTNDNKKRNTWLDVKKGTAPLFSDANLRYVLLLQLATAIVGAQILVNTVGYVKGSLLLGDTEYGWVMSVFGLGAALSAFLLGSLQERFNPLHLALSGSLIIAVAILPGNYSSLPFIMLFWMIAGFGDSFVNVPMQTLIADRVPKQEHGKVYGAHFAWSHFWWALSYPLAGILGDGLKIPFFMWGGVISLFIIVLCSLLFYPGKDEQATIKTG